MTKIAQAIVPPYTKYIASFLDNIPLDTGFLEGTYVCESSSMSPNAIKVLSDIWPKIAIKVKYTIWGHSTSAVEVKAPTIAIDAVVVTPCVLPMSAKARSFSNTRSEKPCYYKNL